MLFLLMGTRHRRCETGVLKPEGKQTLSNLLVYLVVPAMIVNSYRMESVWKFCTTCWPPLG